MIFDPLTLGFSALALVFGTLVTRRFFGNPYKLVDIIMSDTKIIKKKNVFKNVILLQVFLMFFIGIIGVFLSKYVLLFSIGCIMYYTLYVLPKVKACLRIMDNITDVLNNLLERIISMNQKKKEQGTDIPDGVQYYTFDLDGDLTDLESIKVSTKEEDHKALANTISLTEKDKNDQK